MKISIKDIEKYSTKEELFLEAEKRGFVTGAVFHGSEGSDKDIDIRININYKIKYWGQDKNNSNFHGLYCGNSWIYNSKCGWGTVVGLDLDYKKLYDEIDNLLKEFDEEIR